MARLLRPLRQLPLLQLPHCYSLTQLSHLLSSPLPSTTTSRTTFPRFSFATATSSRRDVRRRPRGLRLPGAPLPPDSEDQEGDTSDSDADVKKSRNQKKREARRAVRWGMDLASFSNPQIKRILRAASLGQDVFDALLLLKRLGPDVREGKRRQYNYIGKLLREVEPELMDALIQATKVGDQKTLQALAGSQIEIVEDDYEESEYEESQEHVNIASRWFDGLINKDIQITNEVYSVNNVDFDRQELRKLVRKVHMIQEQNQAATEENEEAKKDAAIIVAKKSLSRFLRVLARQLPNE